MYNKNIIYETLQWFVRAYIPFVSIFNSVLTFITLSAYQLFHRNCKSCNTMCMPTGKRFFSFVLCGLLEIIVH